MAVDGIERAIALAVRAHNGQRDLSGKPIILHPLRVMFEFIGDDTMMAAAVLHDVVEDSEVTVGEIRSQFGAEVAEIVDSVSRRLYEKYFDFIERCRVHPQGRRLKLADLQDNMRPDRALWTSEHDGLRKRYVKAMGILQEG